MPDAPAPPRDPESPAPSPPSSPAPASLAPSPPRQSTPGTRVPYKNHYTIIIALFYLVEGMNFSMFGIIVPIYVLTTAGSLDASVFGFLAGFIMTPWMIKFVFGVMSDKANFQRFGRRKPWVMVCGSLGGIVWVFVPLLLTTFPADPVMVFAVAGLFIAFGIAIGDTNVDGLILDICPPAKLGRVQGVCFAAKSAGTVVGGPVAALLTYVMPAETIFVGFGLLVVASSLLTALVRENPHPEKTELWLKVKNIIGARANWRAYAYAFTVSLTNGVVGTYVALYVLVQLGVIAAEGASVEIFEGNLDLYVPQANVSLLIGAGIFVGALVGGYLADKKGRRLAANVGFLISVVSFLLVPLGLGIAFLITVVVVVGYGQGNRDAVFSAIISELAKRRYPDADVTYYSIANSFNNMGLTAGLMITTQVFALAAGLTSDTAAIYLIVFGAFALMSAVAPFVFRLLKPAEYELKASPEREALGLEPGPTPEPSPKPTS